jgi:hypothetical protein
VETLNSLVSVLRFPEKAGEGMGERGKREWKEGDKCGEVIRKGIKVFM